jgi:dephospho-CoA kinase
MATTPLIIGVTGSIGSGKSAVGAILAHKGALVIDADQLAREVVAPGTTGYQEVIAHFGQAVAPQPNGAIDRQRLAAIVFADSNERKVLEGIVHPKIRALFLEKLGAAQQSENPPWLIAYLVPLLFESGYSYDELDYIVVVSATEQLCIDRVVARDRITPEQVRKRLAAQLPIAEKERRADFVVQNNGSAAELEQEVERLLESLPRQMG